jgi:hypothetical protein
MDWTMTEGYNIPIGSSCAHSAPKEVSLVSFTLHLRAFTCKQRYRRLQQAYASDSLKLVKRLHALVALAQGQSVSDVAEMLSRSEQTVRDYRNQLSLSRFNHWLPRGEDEPGMMEGTAEVPHQIADAHLS